MSVLRGLLSKYVRDRVTTQLVTARGRATNQCLHAENRFRSHATVSRINSTLPVVLFYLVSPTL